jgi:hypothetical protein
MKTGAPQVVSVTYDLLLYLIPQVSKFPRSQRYLLGDRLERACFDVFEMLILAAYSREKVGILEKANVRLEQARYYLRLCKDLKLVSVHRYEIASKKINEIGMQIGGWLKSQRRRT